MVSAYSFWGVTPIYYKWVEFAGPLEVSAHRIVWALLILAALVTLSAESLHQGWRLRRHLAR